MACMKASFNFCSEVKLTSLVMLRNIGQRCPSTKHDPVGRFIIEEGVRRGRASGGHAGDSKTGTRWTRTDSLHLYWQQTPWLRSGEPRGSEEQVESRNRAPIPNPRATPGRRLPA